MVLSSVEWIAHFFFCDFFFVLLFSHPLPSTSTSLYPLPLPLPLPIRSTRGFRLPPGRNPGSRSRRMQGFWPALLSSDFPFSFIYSTSCCHLIIRSALLLYSILASFPTQPNQQTLSLLPHANHHATLNSNHQLYFAHLHRIHPAVYTDTSLPQRLLFFQPQPTNLNIIILLVSSKQGRPHKTLFPNIRL